MKGFPPSDRRSDSDPPPPTPIMILTSPCGLSCGGTRLTLYPSPPGNLAPGKQDSPSSRGAGMDPRKVPRRKMQIERKKCKLYKCNRYKKIQTQKTHIFAESRGKPQKNCVCSGARARRTPCCQRLSQSLGQLPPEDRIGLLSDSFALCKAGHADPPRGAASSLPTAPILERQRNLPKIFLPV